MRNHGSIQSAVALLNSKERLLVEMALKHGLSRRQMGLALDLPPGTVTRRLRRLVNRLYDPLIDALMDRTCTLSSEERQVGIEYFLQRKPVGEIAREHGLSRWATRQMIEFIRGWQRGIRQQQQPQHQQQNHHHKL